MDPTLERQMLFRGFCFFLYEIRGFIEMIRLVLSSLASYGSDIHTYRRVPSYTHTSTTPPTHTYTHTGADGHYTRACTRTLTQSKYFCFFAETCIFEYPLDRLSLSDKALKGLQLDNFQNC